MLTYTHLTRNVKINFKGESPLLAVPSFLCYRELHRGLVRWTPIPTFTAPAVGTQSAAPGVVAEIDFELTVDGGELFDWTN